MTCRRLGRRFRGDFDLVVDLVVVWSARRGGLLGFHQLFVLERLGLQVVEPSIALDPHVFERGIEFRFEGGDCFVVVKVVDLDAVTSASISAMRSSSSARSSGCAGGLMP